MEVTASSAYQEILRIRNEPPTNPEFEWEMTLITPAGSIILDDIVALVTERDYVENISDAIKLATRIGMGTFIHDIYPHKDNLSVEIVIHPVANGTREPDPMKPSYKRKYRAILFHQDSKGLQGSSMLTNDKAAGDRSKKENVYFQLIDPIIDKIRTRTLSGIFSGTWEDILKALLKHDLSLEPKTPKEDVNSVINRNGQWFVNQQGKLEYNSLGQNIWGFVEELQGVEVVPVDTPKPAEHIMLRTGTPITEIPFKLQEEYGLYSHTLASYVERGIWYVWGLHNTGRFENAERTLRVAIIESNTLPTTNKSYKVEDGHVSIIATGQPKHYDLTESLMQTEGNGVRYMDAGASRNPAKTKDGITTISRAANMKEFMVEKRTDGLNLIRYAPDRITSNHQQELSRLNARRGTVLHLEWHNSDDEVLQPGLPTRIYYVDNNDVKSVDGILIGNRHAHAAEEDSITDKRIRCNSVLSFWIDRDI